MEQGSHPIIPQTETPRLIFLSIILGIAFHLALAGVLWITAQKGDHASPAEKAASVASGPPAEAGKSAPDRHEQVDAQTPAVAKLADSATSVRAGTTLANSEAVSPKVQAARAEAAQVPKVSVDAPRTKKIVVLATPQKKALPASHQAVKQDAKIAKEKASRSRSEERESRKQLALQHETQQRQQRRAAAEAEARKKQDQEKKKAVARQQAEQAAKRFAAARERRQEQADAAARERMRKEELARIARGIGGGSAKRELQ